MDFNIKAKSSSIRLELCRDKKYPCCSSFNFQVSVRTLTFVEKNESVYEFSSQVEFRNNFNKSIQEEIDTHTPPVNFDGIG